VSSTPSPSSNHTWLLENYCRRGRPPFHVTAFFRPIICCKLAILTVLVPPVHLRSIGGRTLPAPVVPFPPALTFFECLTSARGQYPCLDSRGPRFIFFTPMIRRPTHLFDESVREVGFFLKVAPVAVPTILVRSKISCTTPEGIFILAESWMTPTREHLLAYAATPSSPITPVKL